MYLWGITAPTLRSMAPPTDPKAAREATPSEEPSGTNQQSLSRGTLVDRYTILQALGSGGIATVYSAYDAQLERLVALKMLRPHVDVPEVRKRLFREAQAMARLKHPNVVTVYDVGKFRRQIYIAMEFVDGTTLKEWVSRPWREVLSVLKAAGRGLAAAHDVGFAHRDFKPENVLVGKDGRVLVTDFGIARVADGSEALAASQEHISIAEGDAPDTIPPSSEEYGRRWLDSLTETGQVVGTEGFMAPETLLSGRADARSDQFSFCVTMYVALYGKHPFPFTNLPTYCAAVLKPPEPPPSPTKVPSWLHAVIEQGLRQEPEQRFASMKELLDALDSDPSRRRRIWAMGACLAAVCAVAATAYGRHRIDLRQRCAEGAPLMAAIWNPTVERQTRESLTRADPRDGATIAEQTIGTIGQYATIWAETYRRVFEATLLRGEQDAATLDRRVRCLERGREQFAAVTEVLVHADLAVVQHALDATSALPAPAHCADSDVARIPALPTAPEARAPMLEIERAVAQAQAYGRLGQERQVEDIIARVLPQIRAIPYPRAEAELLLLDAESKRQLSDTRGAIQAFQGAFHAAVRAADDVVAVRAATSLVYMNCVWLHKTEEGEQWMALAEAIADRGGHSDAIDAYLLSGRTAINDTTGHPERNVELREKHVGILKRLYGDRDPRVAGAVTDLGVTLALLGNYAAAVKYIQEGIDRQAATGGSHNPRLALHYLNLAGALAALGRFEEAKGAYETALALLADHPPGATNVILLSELAGVENELGHADAALDDAQKALDVARATGEKGKFEWQARFVHAQARGKKSDWRGQAAECAEIVALQRSAGKVAPKIPYWPDALACVAEAELALHKVDAALAHLEESVKLASREDVEGLPRARFALAKALRMAGRDPTRARHLAESALDDLRKLAGKGRDVANIEEWMGREFPTFASRR